MGIRVRETGVRCHNGKPGAPLGFSRNVFEVRLSVLAIACVTSSCRETRREVEARLETIGWTGW